MVNVALWKGLDGNLSCEFRSCAFGVQRYEKAVILEGHPTACGFCIFRGCNLHPAALFSADTFYGALYQEALIGVGIWITQHFGECGKLTLGEGFPWLLDAAKAPVVL